MVDHRGLRHKNAQVTTPLDPVHYIIYTPKNAQVMTPLDLVHYIIYTPKNAHMMTSLPRACLLHNTLK